jgi:hypothetical protein
MRMRISWPRVRLAISGLGLLAAALFYPPMTQQEREQAAAAMAEVNSVDWFIAHRDKVPALAWVCEHVQALPECPNITEAQQRLDADNPDTGATK